MGHGLMTRAGKACLVLGQLKTWSPMGYLKTKQNKTKKTTQKTNTIDFVIFLLAKIKVETKAKIKPLELTIIMALIDNSF